MAVDRLSMQFYSLLHPRGPHVQGIQFYLGNPGLPAIKGGLITGCVFTFARSLGEFGATIMVSGNLALRTQTAPLYIFLEFNKGNIAAANSMSVLLVVISLALFWGFKLVTRMLENRGTTGAERNITEGSDKMVR